MIEEREGSLVRTLIQLIGPIEDQNSDGSSLKDDGSIKRTVGKNESQFIFPKWGFNMLKIASRLSAYNATLKSTSTASAHSDEDFTVPSKPNNETVSISVFFRPTKKAPVPFSNQSPILDMS